MRGEAKRKARQFEAELRGILASDLDDASLLAALQARAAEMPFRGYTWLWGPPLYRRNRTLFRPFVWANFSNFLVVDSRNWERVEWKGEVSTALEAWIEEADRQDDLPVFKALYQWRARDTLRPSAAARRWSEELLDRFQRAATPATRAATLRKFEMGYALDEDAALALYRLDPALAADFILKHLPQRWYGGDKRKLWDKLFAAAANQGDETLQYRLYRRMVPLERWGADVRALARTVADADALCAALEQRHPEGWGLDLGGMLHELVAARGRDVLPYVRRHLRDVWSHWYRSGYDKLVALAERQGWWDLWGALICVCARPNEYNAAVKALLADQGLDDETQRARLLRLSGVSREWNFVGLGLAQVQRLEEDVALDLYRRYPDLLRGAFRLHVQPGWGSASGKLLEAAIAAKDEILIDFLASRLATRVVPGKPTEALLQAAESASRYYEALRLDEPSFARRAASVLTQIPAYTIWHYGDLLRTNRLARLLFERSSRFYLGSEPALRDLVEGSEIHVQALAYRALALDDERARELARANLDLLLGTLLRPLHRTTRAGALRALANAATTPEAGATVLNRAREALELPDVRYPKDALVQLIGRILHRYPDLRRPGEQPVVFRRAA